MKLSERFETLGRTRTPDLWPVIERRETRPVSEPPHRHRILAATVALAVAAAGMGLLMYAFGRDEQPRPAASVQNGKIAFLKAVQSDDYINGEQTDIYVMNPDGSGVAPLIQDPTYDTNPAWSPDGTRIVFSRGGLLIANADGTSVKTILEDGTGATDPSWSPAGTRIVFESGLGEESTGRGDRDLFVINADGSGLTRLTADPAREGFPAWSPDGTKIAFVRYLAPSDPEIFLMNADGTGVAQLTMDGGTGLRPAWSPDGTQLAFERDGDINVVGADGSGLRNLTNDPASDGDPAWSPDGTKISFASDRDGDWDIYVANVDGSGLTRLTHTSKAEGDPAWQSIPATAVRPTPSETPAPSLSPTVVATKTVGEDVRSVTYGSGSVWVAVSNNDGSFGGSILRIDPETGETVATITVESVPTWELGGGAMAVGDGSLWVTGGIEAPGGPDSPGGGSDATLIRIDPITNEVVDTIILGGSVGADVAVDGSGVWVLLFGDERVDHRMEVVRIDPSTREVVARIPLEARWAHTLVAIDGRILVNDGRHLTSIDPWTNRITANETIPLRYSALGPVVWEGQLWVALGDALRRFDPHTARPTGEAVDLDPAETAVCCMFIASGDSGIWFAGYDGVTGQGPPRLAWFDPATGRIQAFMPLDQDTPVAMAVAPNSVWVLGYDGHLTWIELH